MKSVIVIAADLLRGLFLGPLLLAAAALTGLLILILGLAWLWGRWRGRA